MDSTTILEVARVALDAAAGRVADLLCSLTDADAPIAGSEWTVRDAAVHLAAGAGAYVELANGAASPITASDGPGLRDAVARYNAKVLADVPEAEPSKLALLVLDSTGALVDATVGRPGDSPVPFHNGTTVDLARLVCILLGEQLLHGYDMAAAVGAPWPINPGEAALVLHGYGDALSQCVNPATTRGLSATWEVVLAGADPIVVRIADGECTYEAPGAAVDCVLAADPATFLMTCAGRVPPAAAIAVNALRAGGPKPGLALRFFDCFVRL